MLLFEQTVAPVWLRVVSPEELRLERRSGDAGGVGALEKDAFHFDAAEPALSFDHPASLGSHANPADATHQLKQLPMLVSERLRSGAYVSTPQSCAVPL